MSQQFTNDSSSRINAIPTEYKGYRFRSRLEARWAVFFETLGLPWKYEPEGFECEGYEGKKVRYLPDFYLPRSETWIEVKGTKESLLEEQERLEQILDWNSPLPGMRDSYHLFTPPLVKVHGLAILGDIPDPSFGLSLHPIIQHHEGLIWSWFAFTPSSIEISHRYGGWMSYYVEEPEEWDIKHIQFNTPRSFKKVTDAYKAARQARFEHGETP